MTETIVSLTGLSIHVKDQATLEAMKAWYLALPGAEIDHERAGFNCVIRIGNGRLNIVTLNRPEDFHIESGSTDLDALRTHLAEREVQPDGPQPEKWGQRGVIVRDPAGNLVEFDDQI
jgi:catechol 2,3-dioxygenase-like lactoylglutathione lyase family enzyme